MKSVAREKLPHVAPGAVLQRPYACGNHASTGVLQRSAVTDTPAVAPPIVHEVLRSPGRPLDAETRAFMEPRFGRDFSHIRVHTGPLAARSAIDVGARAYTVGQQIVFGAELYQPHCLAGQRLLAHELAHSVQQRCEPSPHQQLSAVEPARSPLEDEADRAAIAVLDGDMAHVSYRGVAIIMRQQTTAAVERHPETTGCTKTYRPASSFRTLIDLVRAAEERLVTCGNSSVEERIHILRGIYYGTPWSADYAVEHSPVRNAGFQIYTGSTMPDDPRRCLDCGLFEALRASQDVTDGHRRVDVGHLIIGMDARRSVVARSVTIPSQGATGLAISTWVGDLGGGAAMLSVSRITNPRRLAVDFFRGSNFGGSINLEGDIAGYLVAPNPTSPAVLATPHFGPGQGVADALEAYLLPASGSTETNWNTRCHAFLSMVGGTFTPSGALANRATVVSSLAGQIEGFACWYLVNRLRQTGRLSLTMLESASEHIVGASNEMATVFVDILEYCTTHPGSSVVTRGAGPPPSPPGTASGFCAASIQAIRATERARKFGSELEREAGNLWRRLGL